jgi:hypothetical protein
MSTKFEQLLDYLVNEEMDKANELFHEIVVEKSRSIYENLIAEEEAEEDVEEGADEDQEESVEEAEEDQEESVEESQDTEMDEGDAELEDSYNMSEEDDGFSGDSENDPTGKLGMEIGADHDEEGGEADEDSAMMDIKNAIEELEAAFAELEQAQGGEHDSMDAEFGDEEGEEDGEDEMMGMPAMEGRRITREYTEKVGNDWDKNSQKTQGQYLGAGTGDTEGAPVEGKSPIASGKNKPGPAGVNAKNLNQGATEGQKNTGERPNAPVKGITPTSGDKFAKGIHNVDGVKSGVKTLDKVAGGHGAEKKGSGPGPVGAGTGDKAGQTNIDPATKRQFLPSQG